MNTFTCLTCRVVLPTADSQRLHYKQEWHSYNLKRKLAALSPVTYDHYSRIETLHQKNDTKDGPKRSFYCETCGKQFNNSNAFDQHMSSKKHKISVKTGIKSNDIKEPKVDPKKETQNEEIEDIEEDNADVEDDNDSDWESVDSNDGSNEEMGDEDPIAANQCLFCEESSDSVEDNVYHMSQKHSFFIPDVDYLKSLEPLLTYLGEKVGFGHYCLWCCDSGKRFKSRRAAQQHMRDRGHTKMCHYNHCLLEYSQFYDYTSSYPDFEGHKPEDEEEVIIPHLDDQDWQLTLPSGAVIGHRSLFRYYKQNLKPLTENSEKFSKSSAILDKVMSRYRSLGWTGITGEAALQRAKDIKFVQRIQRRQELKTGMKNNWTLRQRFKDPNGV